MLGATRKTLGICAPSGPFERDSFLRGVERLGSRFHVRFDEGIYARLGYLAGDDEHRSRELQALLFDPAVEVIVAARGGYGATRVLEVCGNDLLYPNAIARAGKPIVGFSDITALHALWQSAGVRSVHGPMVGKIAQLGEAAFDEWCAVINGATPSPFAGATLRAGRAHGPIVGGNLAVLHALQGTPFMPSLGGKVLVLEDIDEPPYRVDRMLTSMRSAGDIQSVAGIVLGDFTNGEPRKDGRTIDDVIADRILTLGVPVMRSHEIGHVDANRALPLGVNATLLAGDAGATLTYDAATWDTRARDQAT